MVKLARRNNEEKSLEEKAAEVEEQINDPLPERNKPIDLTKAVSTGSTLLDLTISGRRRREGGIPGGIVFEIFGNPGSGKTALLSEISSSVQSKGGRVMFLDPEARLDRQYAEIYGIKLENKDYYRPNTVEEVFEKIYTWKPNNDGFINLVATDSLAALSTTMEMEDQDKMGMKRAKCFSEGLRKTARIISDNDWIVGCTNQTRQGQFGETSPGGEAIKFYCSLRINIKQLGKIEKEKDFHGKKIKKVLGIESKCNIIKSSIDDPFRSCNVSIIFGWGIDTVRDELQFYKDSLKETAYNCFDETYQSIDKAIEYIDGYNLQGKLKERTIDLWNEMEDLFLTNRKRIR